MAAVGLVAGSAGVAHATDAVHPASTAGGVAPVAAQQLAIAGAQSHVSGHSPKGGGPEPASGGHAATTAKSQAPAQHATAQHATAQQAAARHTAARPAPAQPYRIYDSTTPSAIPSGGMVAAYATGAYAVSPSSLAGRGPVLWIDVTGTDYAASVLDVEPGNATPAQSAIWAYHRLKAYPNALARIYTYMNAWPAVKAAVATLPAWMRSHVRYWIADPTGYPHIVPGSDATQWNWGSSYDTSTATPRF